MFADCFDADGEVKNPKQLAQRHRDFVDAMSKSTYNGLTGRTWIDSETDTGTPLIKSRESAAAELRESATRAGFAKSAQAFNYSSPSNAGYGQLVKEWTLTSPIPSGLVPYDLFRVAA
jgi:hypothetical protein